MIHKTTKCSNQHLPDKIVTLFSTDLGATSKFLVSEEWYEASSILGTHNSGVTCKPQCYLVVAAWCKWTDDHFLYVREKTYSNYVEDTRCHHTKYSYL